MSSLRKESLPENLRIVHGGTQSLWHASATVAVRRPFVAGDHAQGWTAWKNHLARRKRPADLAEILPGKSWPLDWALVDRLDSCPTPAWLDRARRLLKGRRAADSALEKELLRWLAESTGNTAGTTYALEALACCHALPRLAALLSADVWFALLDHLLGAVSDARAIDLEDDPLVNQLLAGELPLTLARLFPEITPCRKLARAARQTLSTGLVDLLDGEGMPQGAHLVLLRPLLACWTRCCALGEQLKGGSFTAAAAVQYEWLVRQAMRLTRHDGTHVFSNGSTGGWCADLFEAALQLGGDDDDRQIALQVLPQCKKSGKKLDDELPPPAFHSEWAATTVLRPEWSRSGERLTALYGDQSLRLELSCGRDVLWSGTWELEVRIDGHPVRPTSDWEEVCWTSDDDCDFLELEIELGDQLRVQRQMLMARQDGFLLLGDVVLGERSAKIEYRSCLPLCPSVSFQGAKETQEGFLVGSKRCASVLPLALAEWRSDRQIDCLKQTRRGLELRQTSQGSNLYAPLFFDLDRRRQARVTTWRQITVAESLAIQPNDVAVGYRVAVGKEQWLIYRSLAEKANRTLLGHNLSSETLVAQFDRTGEVEPLVEIE